MLAVGAGHATSALDRRQILTTAQNNISDSFIPPTTQRWTLSVEAQVQGPTQQGTLQPRCTVQICLGSGICGTAKALTTTWSTVTLVTRLTANEAQTVIFVNSCSGPANVALRSMSVPGRFLAVTTTAVRTAFASTLAPETQTMTLDASTVVSTFRPPPNTETLTLEVSTIVSTFYPPTPSSSSSSESSTSTLEPAPEPEPEPEPNIWFSLSAINYCSEGNSAIFSTPDSKDWLIFLAGSSLGFGLYSGDPTASFAPTSGVRMCAKVERTGIEQCAYDVLEVTSLRSQDIITLTCPDPAPPRPDLSTPIPLNIRTSASSPNLVIQIGCEPGNYCLSYAIQGNSQNNDFSYPILSPMARLRVKVFGSNMRYAEWKIAFSGAAPRTRYQPNTQWLDITVPVGASRIDLQASGMYSGTAPEPEPEPEPEITVGTHNRCLQQPHFLQRVSGPSSEHLYFLEPLRGGSVMLYSRDPTMRIERPGPICVFFFPSWYQPMRQRQHCCWSAARPGVLSAEVPGTADVVSVESREQMHTGAGFYAHGTVWSSLDT